MPSQAVNRSHNTHTQRKASQRMHTGERDDTVATHTQLYNLIAHTTTKERLLCWISGIHRQCTQHSTMRAQSFGAAPKLVSCGLLFCKTEPATFVKNTKNINKGTFTINVNSGGHQCSRTARAHDYLSSSCSSMRAMQPRQCLHATCTWPQATAP